MTERFERFTADIFEIYRYWHKIAADEMEKYGLKGSHAVYLVVLYNLKEGVTAARLSQLCGKDKSDVSRIMCDMEKQGLVVKQGENKYRAALTLTEKGVAAAEYVRERAEKVVEIASQGISASQRETMYRTLEKISENLKKHYNDLIVK
jgi:DNA-binding MarR family transcriptional regulator